MFVDSHCHLDFPDLIVQVDDILSRMQTNRVSHALCVSVNLPDWPGIMKLVEQHDCLWASVGVHPDYRKRGLSRILMEAVFSKYRERVDFIYLFTGQNNREFYPIFGFSEHPMQQFSLDTTTFVAGEKRLHEADVAKLRRKIKLIIQTAVRFDYDTIVFGAMGCGAWRNPAKHVAEIFKDVLQEYDGLIKNYFFAILSTVGDDAVKDSNITIFQKVFERTV